MTQTKKSKSGLIAKSDKKQGILLKSDSKASTDELHSPAKQRELLKPQMRAAAQALKRIREAELRSKKPGANELVYTSLHGHLSVGMLAIAFYRLNRAAVPGIDKVTKEEYQRNLIENLTNLRNQIASEKYKFTPVKRTYIPKATGGTRPLGICIIEDKIVQGAVKLILEAIYDAKFVGLSYGFRPDTRAHDALDALYMAISSQDVNYILDADIVGYFDNINHDVLIKLLMLTIRDRKILRLINWMLKAGIMEEGTFLKQTQGVVQGAVISPLLANIYLHHVLDKFFVHWRQWNKDTEGFSCMVRYADDFVMGFQSEHQAKRFLMVLQDRMLCAGLRLHEKKTRLIRFGKTARQELKKRGERPKTFQFLGFEFKCSITLKTKRFKILMHTAGSRIQKKVTEVSRRLRTLILSGESEQAVKYLNSFLKGYYGYFAVHENTKILATLRYRLVKILFTLLNRRSQKRSMTWEKFNKLIEPLIMSPKVSHLYPSERYASRQKSLGETRYTTKSYETLESLV